jgi:dihydropteroate synthase
MAGSKYILLRDSRRFEFKENHMEFMGIINATPDSFFQDSRISGIGEALKKASRMIEEGATWLDVGGESTRPGSDSITQEDERHRIIPVIKAIKESFPHAIVSADTWRAKTAYEAIKAGADVINDISAMTFDEDMSRVVAETGTPIILMHLNGRPKNMQDSPQYKDVVSEVYSFLDSQINAAIKAGLPKEKLMIDMGIGFGKTCEHNLQLLRNIKCFESLGCPHIMAVSRKSFIGKVLGEDNPENRLYGTIGVTAYGAANGINMARVHDVLPNLQAARMVEALKITEKR